MQHNIGCVLLTKSAKAVIRLAAIYTCAKCRMLGQV